MHSVSRFLLLSGTVLALGALSACTTGPDVDRQSIAMMQQHLGQPFFVNASQVAVEMKYDPLANQKDVSGTLPVPLDKAVKSYAENRFRPAGSQGVFHVVIEDASVFHEALGSAVPVGGFLGLGDQERYTGSVKINLYRDGASSGIGAQGYMLRMERTLTMQADVSMDERDARLTAFTTDLLNDIDRTATEQITKTLLLSAPVADLAPSPGPHPPIPVEKTPMN